MSAVSRAGRTPNRRLSVASLAVLASLLLHALMILPFARGGSTRYPSATHAEGAAVSVDGSGTEPVLTLVQIDDKTIAAEPDEKPPDLPLQDLEPEREAVAFDVPELPSTLNLPGESLDQGDVPASSSPPTEVSALLPYGERGDRVGEMVRAEDVVQSCRHAHPIELQRADHDIDVALRVFVLPDGRIAQGAVAVSSGNKDFDRVVFQCVQALANVTPLVVDSNPVGSWQTISTHW
jgi:outer membrane biosynthesis protein TonB